MTVVGHDRWPECFRLCAASVRVDPRFNYVRRRRREKRARLVETRGGASGKTVEKRNNVPPLLVYRLGRADTMNLLSVRYREIIVCRDTTRAVTFPSCDREIKVYEEPAPSASINSLRYCDATISRSGG